MKDLHVQRTVGEGWSGSSIESRNTAFFRQAATKAARTKTIATAASGMVPLVWIAEPVRAAAAATPLVAVPLFLTSLLCAITFVVGLFQLPDYYGRRARALHLPGEVSNDPYGAVDATDYLVEELRTATRNPRRLAAAYEDAVEKLQKLSPDVPLRALVREGYYPSRPTVQSNGSITYLDNDASAPHLQWDRMSAALDDLRSILKSSDVLTRQQVKGAVSRLVPPLRAVLRRHGVDTHRIEYLPPKRPPAEISGETNAAQTALPAPGSAADPVVEPMPIDALTPVEDRLNASATMAVSSIRTLALSLETAEKDLFAADDLQAGRSLMAQHVPSLVRAYVVAHDASQGEERDQVRAEFAQGLGIVRDTLAGIMRRHAQEARRRMEDETRFLRMRHGEGDASLSPARDTPVS